MYSQRPIGRERSEMEESIDPLDTSHMEPQPGPQKQENIPTSPEHGQWSGSQITSTQLPPFDEDPAHIQMQKQSEVMNRMGSHAKFQIPVMRGPPIVMRDPSPSALAASFSMIEAPSEPRNKRFAEMVQLNFPTSEGRDNLAVTMNVVETWEKLQKFIEFNQFSAESENQILSIMDSDGCIVDEDAWPPVTALPRPASAYALVQLVIDILPKSELESLKGVGNMTAQDDSPNAGNTWCCYVISPPDDLPITVTINAKDECLGFYNIYSTNKHEGTINAERDHEVGWEIVTKDGHTIEPVKKKDMIIRHPDTSKPLKLYHELQFCMSWKSPTSRMTEPIISLRVEIARVLAAGQDVLKALGFPNHKVMDFRNYWNLRFYCLHPTPEYMKLDVYFPNAVGVPLHIKPKVNIPAESLKPGAWYKREITQVLFTFTPIGRSLSPSETVDLSAEDLVNIKTGNKYTLYLDHGCGHIENLHDPEHMVYVFEIFGIFLPHHIGTIPPVYFHTPNFASPSTTQISPKKEPSLERPQSSTGWSCCNPTKSEDHYGGYLDTDEDECWSCFHKICENCKMGVQPIGQGVYRKLGAEKKKKRKDGRLAESSG